jgi:hypothetical protein
MTWSLQVTALDARVVSANSWSETARGARLPDSLANLPLPIGQVCASSWWDGGRLL